MNDPRIRIAVAVSLIVAGVVVAAVGYLGVSSETEVAFQLPYFASAGVGALMLMGAGSGLLLMTQLERDVQRLDELEDAVRLMATELGRLADQIDASSNGHQRRSRTARERAAAGSGGARRLTP